MDFKVCFAMAATAMLPLLSGCSTPREVPAPAPTSVSQATAPRAPTITAHAAFFTQPMARAEPGPELKPPQFCHVSIDCMDLDSRPFAPCLAYGAPCEGEGGFMHVSPVEILRIETVDRYPEKVP